MKKLERLVRQFEDAKVILDTTDSLTESQKRSVRWDGSVPKYNPVEMQDYHDCHTGENIYGALYEANLDELTIGAGKRLLADPEKRESDRHEGFGNQIDFAMKLVEAEQQVVALRKIYDDARRAIAQDIGVNPNEVAKVHYASPEGVRFFEVAMSEKYRPILVQMTETIKAIAQIVDVE